MDRSVADRSEKNDILEQEQKKEQAHEYICTHNNSFFVTRGLKHPKKPAV